MKISDVLGAIRFTGFVVLAVYFFAQIPIYGTPFAGCDEGSFWSWSGCAPWPEFVRGFVFVLFCALALPSKIWLTAVACVIVLVIGALGGSEGTRLGIYREVASVQDYVGLLYLGAPLLLGGVLAAISHYLALRRRRTVPDGAAA